MSANDKTGVGAGSGEWRTPPELWVRLNRMFAFDYDAFASHENALCKHYSTLEGTFNGSTRDGGPSRLSAATGLEWVTLGGEGRRFGNPPYSRGFLARATRWFVESRNDFDISVMLLPDARDTVWWRKWVRPYATDYPIGRVRFLRPDGTLGASPPGGAVVAVYLPDWLRNA